MEKLAKLPEGFRTAKYSVELMNQEIDAKCKIQIESGNIFSAIPHEKTTIANAL